MTNRLFWKLCLIIATGIVALFSALDLVTIQTEEGMSFIDVEHRQQITAWGLEAERLHQSGNMKSLENWLQIIRNTEHTWVAITETHIEHIAGDSLGDNFSDGYNLGRSVDWKIHLYFEDNPIMEVPFSDGETSFLIVLPERMRPGSYLEHIWLSLKIILPMILLGLLSIMLYRHIMNPLRELQLATRRFSQGNLNVRVRELLGSRNDELSDLAETFDQMATRIGELITNQRQLISDLSHELRTPLTRLDIAIQALHDNQNLDLNLSRIDQESKNIRHLVNDSLTLAWLENERPKLQHESLDLADLLDVLIHDAQFEFPDKHLQLDMTAEQTLIENSNHQSLGQALENILRNALRYTPEQETVVVSLSEDQQHFLISINDQGPGVPDAYLSAIFKPFFRVDSSTLTSTHSCGLGLALAQRQLTAIGGNVFAVNHPDGGLQMNIELPKT